MAESPASPALSDALLIAGLTACSYAIGYAYQRGITDHFELPSSLAAPSISVSLCAAAALAGSIGSLLSIVNVVWLFWTSGTALARSVARVVLVSVLAMTFFIPIFGNHGATKPILLVLAYMVISELLFPLITQHRLANYEAKLKAQEEIERRVQDRSLTKFIQVVTGTVWIRLMAFSLFAILLAYLLGHQSVREQMNFFVLGDDPNSVAVLIDGEVMVSGSFDRQSKTLSGSFSVHKLSDGKPWSLRLEKVGPLVPPKIPK